MRLWGLALAAPVVLVISLFLACNGGGSTGDDGSCARICSQMATCEGGVHWAGDCQSECKAIQKDFDPTYWPGVSGCLTCNTGDAYQCLNGVASGVPMSTVNGFLQQLCQWEVMCQPGLTVDQCVGALVDAGTSGGSDLWNLLGLLSSDARQCLTSCIQKQSCSSAESAAANCLQSCNLLGAFPSGSSSCNCGCTGCCSGHGTFSCNNPSCTEMCACDPGYYASGNLECKPTCQMTGCGAHGTCGGNTCTCDTGYTVGMDGLCHYVAKFTSISVGQDAVCATRDDGRIECFVDVSADEAANVPKDTSYTRLCVDTSSIPSFGCGTKTDGSVTCWGQVSSSVFPAGSKAIGCGQSVYCVVDPTGAAQCFDFKGATMGAEPPSGLIQLAISGTYISGAAGGCGRDAAGGVHCFGDLYQTDAGTKALPPDVATGTKDVAVTDQGGCAVTAAGGLSCWGGAGGTIPGNLGTIDRVVLGWQITCVRKADRTVQCWDNAGKDATPSILMGRKVVDLGATSWDVDNNLCVLYDAGAFQCSSQFFLPTNQREVSPTLF
jgi:hypothetical protein